MSVFLAEAIADAIMQYEGWKPGSRSNRNRNPGNLRRSDESQIVDKDGYRVFGTLADGYRALVADVAAKLYDGERHGLSARSTLLALFYVYAPASDDNHPPNYARFVAEWLQGVYTFTVTLNTSFEELERIANWREPENVVSVTEHPIALHAPGSEVPTHKLAGGTQPAVEGDPLSPSAMGRGNVRGRVRGRFRAPR